MHTTLVLAASQAFHFQARRGSVIYLNAGCASVRAAPAWLETPHAEAECVLREGEAYVVGASGWTAISARERSEVVCIAAAGWQERLLLRTGRLREWLAVFLERKRQARPT
ncbi:hypothetical protein [Undibacterium sp.]|uniref:hypothetical protein n=1 Tax=Undibacterium sp. TaxID=1914977 RepID=UPI002D02A1AB|nr:hypothetical protein [Undibacterium sp.]HTD02896.1 hypothetical protein [Undibacterium sp.]